MTPTQTYPAPLAHTAALSRQAALEDLRAEARTSRALRTRLARLGAVIAAGRPVRLSGAHARVQAARQAVLAYAAKHPARVTLTPQELLPQLSTTPMQVSLHDTDGWPTCVYVLTREEGSVTAVTQDGRTHRLTDAAFLALFQTTVYTLRVAPDAALARAA
jgi:hypothetical protein